MIQNLSIDSSGSRRGGASSSRRGGGSIKKDSVVCRHDDYCDALSGEMVSIAYDADACIPRPCDQRDKKEFRKYFRKMVSRGKKVEKFILDVLYNRKGTKVNRSPAIVTNF